MSVRIIENFWTTFQDNSTLIKRCFFHIYRRFPGADNVEESFNAFVLALHDKEVFDKFDLKRLVPESKKDQFEEDVTKEKLEDAGVNVSKKWEQYIYQQTFNFLFNQYKDYGRYLDRFCFDENFFDKKVSSTEESNWIESEDALQQYNSNPANFKDNGDHRGFIYPPTFENHIHPSEEGFDNQLEAVSSVDLKEAILSKVNGTYTREILSMLEEGYEEKEIAEKLEISQQWINRKKLEFRNALKKLRD